MSFEVNRVSVLAETRLVARAALGENTHHVTLDFAMALLNDATLLHLHPLVAVAVRLFLPDHINTLLFLFVGMPLTSIPPLLYGTAWKDTRTTPLVLAALKTGFRGVDTAAQRKHYREDLVGAALQQAEEEDVVKREDVWVQTKYTPIAGQDRGGPIPYDPSTSVRTQVRSSALASLRNLHPGKRWDWSTFAAALDASGASGTAKGKEKAADLASSSPSGGDAPDATVPPTTTAVAGQKNNVPWLDSYLMHSPLRSLEETLEAWREMEALVNDGWARYIGFSNVYDSRIWVALLRSVRIKPYALQNRWHSTSGHDVSLLSTLSPMLSPNDTPEAITYQPFWTLTGNPSLLASTPVLEAAAKRRWTQEQVVYKFVNQAFGVGGLRTAVLCGTTNEEHMRQVVQVVYGEEELDEQEVDAIRKCVYGE